MSAALAQMPAVQQLNEWNAVGQPTARVRLTRRGRIVFGGLATIAAAAALALVASLSAPQAIASNETGKAEFGYVVAAPGASLWQLATELDQSMDPRDLIAEIVQLNQLQGSEVVVGQPIAVPLRYNDSDSVMSAAELGL